MWLITTFGFFSAGPGAGRPGGAEGEVRTDARRDHRVGRDGLLVPRPHRSRGLRNVAGRRPEYAARAYPVRAYLQETI